jgi:hypothetical protein
MNSEMKLHPSDEFYLLIRNGCQVLSVNWAGHGKKGVYGNTPENFQPREGDQIIKVRQVKIKRKTRKK